MCQKYNPTDLFIVQIDNCKSVSTLVIHKSHGHYPSLTADKCQYIACPMDQESLHQIV